MKSSTIAKNRTQLDLCLIFGAWIYFLVPSIKWNFDLTHETVLLNSVIAVKNGLTLHRDIFEPKGFLYPTLLGKIQNLFPTHLSDGQYSRLLQYGLVLVGTLIAWWILSRYAPKFRLVVPVFWLIGNQYWTTDTFVLNRMFWLEPNYLVVVACLFVVASTIFANENKNAHVKILSLILSGLTIGLLPWLRVQGIFISALLYLTIFNIYRDNHKKILFLSLGTSTSFFSPVIYIHLTGGLREWSDQIFVHPFLYSRLGSDHSTMSSSQLLSTAILFLGSTAFLLITLVLLGSFRESRSAQLITFLSLQAFLLVANFIVLRREVNPESNNNPLNWLIIMIEYFPQLIPRMALVISLTSFFVLLLRGKLRNITPIPPSDKVNLLKTLSAINLGMLILLYPNIGHTFIVSLPFLIFISILLENIKNKEEFVILKKFKLGVFRLLCSIIGFSFVLAFASISKEEYSYETKYLAGTTTTSSPSAQSALEFSRIVEKFEPRSVIVLCDGVIPFNDHGQFLSVIPYFGQGDNMQFVNLSAPVAKKLLICGRNRDEDVYRKELASLEIGDYPWELVDFFDIGGRYVGYFVRGK